MFIFINSSDTAQLRSSKPRFFWKLFIGLHGISGFYKLDFICVQRVVLRLHLSSIRTNSLCLPLSCVSYQHCKRRVFRDFERCKYSRLAQQQGHHDVHLLIQTPFLLFHCFSFLSFKFIEIQKLLRIQQGILEQLKYI